ncbi:MAG: hypothetical protein JWN02_1044 [Acidobacteria bacterium]|nr:hypothetical protein [Acidobacteriota bacterium]
MSILAALLLLTALSPAALPPTTLILRNGDRYSIDGPIREENGRVIFRQAGGSLYSVPMAEVDVSATRAAAMPASAVIVVHPDPPPLKPREVKLKVSAEERDRMLRELEKNHSGTPAPRQKSLEELPPPPTPREVEAAKQDEWSWRHRARDHEEAIRRAQENLDLLRARIDQLEQQILGFSQLGYKPRQFTYQTTELQYARDSIPAAELEVTRAKRAWDQFRDDARRQGIMPGWLR